MYVQILRRHCVAVSFETGSTPPTPRSQYYDDLTRILHTYALHHLAAARPRCSRTHADARTALAGTRTVVATRRDAQRAAHPARPRPDPLHDARHAAQLNVDAMRDTQARR